MFSSFVAHSELILFWGISFHCQLNTCEFKGCQEGQPQKAILGIVHLFHLKKCTVCIMFSEVFYLTLAFHFTISRD